jgi:ribosomal protein L40E
MKKYCPSCGKQNPVSAKFCCHCGDSTSLASKVKQKSTLSKTSALETEDGEEEPGDIQITATKLDVEIMPTWGSSNETIGSLMQEGQQTGPTTSDGYKKGGGPEINVKQFLEEFRREAGPLRGDQTIGEE